MRPDVAKLLELLDRKEREGVNVDKLRELLLESQRLERRMRATSLGEVCIDGPNFSGVVDLGECPQFLFR